MNCRAADQHLVDFAPPRRIAKRAEVTDHRQAVDVGYSRAVVGDADKSEMRKIERLEQLSGERDRIRVGAIEGDPLFDLATRPPAA